jgi:hypothetical protein
MARIEKLLSKTSFCPSLMLFFQLSFGLLFLFEFNQVSFINVMLGFG